MTDMVSITEAARILKVSPDTIRRRIRNGELDARKVKTARGSRWQVELTQDAQAEPMHNDAEPMQSEYVNALREQIQSLEAELAARRTEIQQLHALLHQKALPAPSWWQRLFGRR
ncbi:MAG: hypothetical protein HW402_924 [Dehalococcoidales bacterium]|nr:hypothetical protein [Dehalococcoidales bacterium]